MAYAIVEESPGVTVFRADDLRQRTLFGRPRAVRLGRVDDLGIFEGVFSAFTDISKPAPALAGSTIKASRERPENGLAAIRHLSSLISTTSHSGVASMP